MVNLSPRPGISPTIRRARRPGAGAGFGAGHPLALSLCGRSPARLSPLPCRVGVCPNVQYLATTPVLGPKKWGRMPIREAGGIRVAQGTLEERVAYLEGKVEEQSRLGGELREMIAHLDQKVDRFREELSGRIDALDHRLSGRIDALDQKVSRQFLWLVGLHVTVLLAVVGALIGALFRG